MRSFFKNNGLTIALLALFAFSLVGQAFTGLGVENQYRISHGEAPTQLLPYLGSGAFLSALFENWESEFLQMWAYVVLTAYLFQRGSPESKDPDAKAPQDRNPALDVRKADAPWPVRAGRLAQTVYSHSLGWALLLLFLASFGLHWINSARHAAAEGQAHGETGSALSNHLGSVQFWFESFQNWQSEFLSTALIILLGIVLRERGSPESKPVAAPHSETGA